jgi:hypothetical protein
VSLLPDANILVFMGQRWGRQIAVAMTESDEKAFLHFLRTASDLQILVSPARTKEELYLADFPHRRTKQTQFFLWNKKFAWETRLRSDDRWRVLHT